MKNLIITLLLLIASIAHTQAQSNQSDTLLRQAGAYGQASILFPAIATTVLLPLSIMVTKQEEKIILYSLIGIVQLIGVAQQYTAWTRIKQYSKESAKQRAAPTTN